MLWTTGSGGSQREQKVSEFADHISPSCLFLSISPSLPLSPTISPFLTASPCISLTYAESEHLLSTLAPNTTIYRLDESSFPEIDVNNTFEYTDIYLYKYAYMYIQSFSPCREVAQVKSGTKLIVHEEQMSSRR